MKTPGSLSIVLQPTLDICAFTGGRGEHKRKRQSFFPPRTYMPAIAGTNGRLHSEFIRLLFLQAHRETDRFFAASGVQLVQTDRGVFHYRRSAFSSMLKSKVRLTLAKAAALRITLNLDGSPLEQPSACEACRFIIFRF